MTSHVTQFGTPGIGAVPYGFHFCHFYSSRQDLLDGLIPYFHAGIKANERCIWIASSPLPIEEIRARNFATAAVGASDSVQSIKHIKCRRLVWRAEQPKRRRHHPALP